MLVAYFHRHIRSFIMYRAKQTWFLRILWFDAYKITRNNLVVLRSKTRRLTSKRYSTWRNQRNKSYQWETRNDRYERALQYSVKQRLHCLLCVCVWIQSRSRSLMSSAEQDYLEQCHYCDQSSEWMQTLRLLCLLYRRALFDVHLFEIHLSVDCFLELRGDSLMRFA